MSLQDLGSIGELLAAIATIATLVYLAREIHQNTKSVQSTNLGTWMNAIHGINTVHLEISDFVDDALYARRKLEPNEYWRWHIHQAQLFYAFEAAFLFHLNGTVDDEFFNSRMRSAETGLSFPGSRQWWGDWAHTLYDQRFIEFVEKNCLNESAEPPAISGMT
jgi:hypothetical protein